MLTTDTTTAADPMTAGDHLIAADKLIGATARATYGRTRETHGKKAPKAQRGHLDAACSLTQAGEALYIVAAMLAEGKTRGSYPVQLYMRVAEAKVQEGLARMTGTGRH